MNSRKTVVALLSLLILIGLMVNESNGQRFLERLRDRIANPPAPVSPPGARPRLQNRTQQAPAANPNANQSSRYQVPNTNQGQAGSGNSAQRPTTPNSQLGNQGVSNNPQGRTLARPLGPQPGATAPNQRPLDLDKLGGSILQRDDSPASTSSAPKTTIGIQAIEANPGYPGVRVLNFKNHSLADDAGLKVGDYIFAIDGVPSPSLNSVTKILSQRNPGDTVTLRIGRDGEVSDLKVPLVGRASVSKPATVDSSAVAMPGDNRSGKIGADVKNIPGSRGVQVTSVTPGSPADTAQLKVGDRIIAINGQMVSDSAGMASSLVGKQPGEQVQLQVVRDDTMIQSNVQLASLEEIQSAGTNPSGVVTADGSSNVGSSNVGSSNVGSSNVGSSNVDNPSVVTPDVVSAGKRPSGLVATSSETTETSNENSGAKPTDEKSGGLLGGFGSVLGGVFGNGEDSPKPSLDPLELPAEGESGSAAIEALPAPEVMPAPVPTPESVADENTAPNEDAEAIRKQIQELQEKLKEIESE